MGLRLEPAQRQSAWHTQVASAADVLTQKPRPLAPSQALQDKSGAFRTMINMVKRGMKDKVANVFLTSLATFQATIDGFAASGGKDIQVGG